MRDAFLRLLAGEPASQIIWTADITYWISGKQFQGQADPVWGTEEGYLRFCQTLGFMPYYWYEKFWLAEPRYDRRVQISTRTQGHLTQKTWQTPIGAISEETTFSPDSCSIAHSKFAVTNKAELEVFRYLIENRSLKPVGIEDYPERLELWRRYDGLPVIALPRSPLSAFFYEWAGVINGIYLLLDFPELVRDIFRLMEKQEEPILDAVCGLHPPLVHFADNLSSDTITGFYEELMEPGHRHRIARLHKAGIKCAVHLDGVVQGLLPKLARVGFDAVEALTPYPGGDQPIEKMRTIANDDHVILWGGVPGILFAPPYTWEDMRRHVEHVLECWAGTRFVLGVADQVPPDGNIEFCRNISDLIQARNP